MSEEVQPHSAVRYWRERLGTPPRDVVATGLTRHWHVANRRWRYVTIAATVACLVAFAIAFPWPLLDTIKLDFAGQKTDGVVTGSRFEYRGLGAHMFMRKRPVYGVRFKYRDHAGDLRTGFSLDTRKFSPGDQVTIEYSGGRETHTARLSGSFFVSGGYWAGIWTCLFPGLSVFGIWNYRRSVQRHRELVRDGVLVPAEIEQLWVDGSPDRGNGWVAFRLHTAGQRIQITQSLQGDTLNRARQIVKRGAQVAVLHHRNEPRECIVLDLLPV